MRPRIEPAVLAAVIDDAPKRLVRKLDETPDLAEAWSWAEDGTVTTDKDAVVRLAPVDGVVRARDQASCDCLLAPRCLHLLAVLSRLELAEAPAAETATEGANAGEAERTETVAALDDAARVVVGQAWKAATDLLVVGLRGAGPLMAADLLRVVHGARVTGLFRLAAAATRVLTRVRQDAAMLESGRADLHELVETAWRLQDDAVQPDALGRSRRRYDPVGSLRLFGVASEAVVTASGYAGVSTLLADEDGRIWSVSDVRPGDVSRVETAYATSIDLGGCMASHREMARAGLFVQGATASAEGRLGAGAGVKATRSKATALLDTPLSGRFDDPLDEQVKRAFAEMGTASGLLFVWATVVGLADDALVMAGDGGEVLRLTLREAHPSLPWRDNADWLARAPGLRVGVIGRVVRDRCATMVPLALVAQTAEPTEEGARLLLPEAWMGRCQLGLDRLGGEHFAGLRRHPQRVELEDAPGADPLAALRRRLERMALGGVATIGPNAMTEIEREARALQRRMMPTGAALLVALGRITLEREQALTGERGGVNADEVARRWLACSLFETGAQGAIRRAAWLG